MLHWEPSGCVIIRITKDCFIVLGDFKKDFEVVCVAIDLSLFYNYGFKCLAAKLVLHLLSNVTTKEL